MFGTHYKKLYTIKQRYDPKGLFWVSPGVGADDFYAEAKTGRVCKGTPPPTNGTARAERLSPRIELPPLNDNQNIAENAPTAYNLGPESQEAADKNKGSSSS